jgi:hypothetical protein
MSDLSVIFVEGYRYTGDDLDLSATDFWALPWTSVHSVYGSSWSSRLAATARYSAWLTASEPSRPSWPSNAA